MRTLSEEQFRSQYGEKEVVKLDDINASRFGASTMASTTKKPMSNRFTEAIGLGGATDVFGSLIARTGFGEATREEAQEFVEKPTAAQTLGAVAQTAAIPAGAVLTGGGSLAGQMAAGAGLGYVYDVGSNLAEGETDAGAFKPGAETLTGALIPPVFRGAGAAFRGAGTLLSRGAKNAPTPSLPSGVGDTVGDTVAPVVRTAKEYAVNRPARLIRRAGEALEETRIEADVYKSAPAPVRAAMDANLDQKVVNAISEADDATKAGYRKVVEIAEEGSDKLGVKARPEIVAGDAAADQYGLINAKRREVGEQIGEAIDNLPQETYNATPLYQEMDNLLMNNGVVPKSTSDGVQLDFSGTNIPPKQRATIQALYDLLTETGDSLTARQLYNKDRLLSQLQREARFDGVSDIMIKTPDGKDADLFSELRTVFSSELEAIAPSIKPLNAEYAVYRNLQNDIEGSIFKSGNYSGTKDIDPAEFAQTNLRRLFSDAQSAADYRKIYDNLDAYSRTLGYEGARADDLAAFATEMRKLYPDSVPATSATGIWGGVVDTAKQIVGAGKADIKDQQGAIRGLLDIPEKYTPVEKASELFGSKSLKQRTTEALKDTRGALNPQRMPKDNPFESLNYSTLSPRGEQLVKKFLSHVDGTQKLSAGEWKDVQADILQLANEANLESKGGGNKEIANELADKYQKYIGN